MVLVGTVWPCNAMGIVHILALHASKKRKTQLFTKCKKMAKLTLKPANQSHNITKHTAKQKLLLRKTNLLRQRVVCI